MESPEKFFATIAALIAVMFIAGMASDAYSETLRHRIVECPRCGHVFAAEAGHGEGE